MLCQTILGICILLARSPDPARRAQELFRDWEQKRHASGQVRWDFERILHDRVYGTETIEKGEASGIRPGLLRVDWKDVDSRLKQTFFYQDDRLLYFDFQTKQEWIISLRRPSIPQQEKKSWGARLINLPADGAQLFRQLFWGVSYEQCQTPFRVQLTKEDAFWAYFRLRPRSEGMKALLGEDQEIDLVVEKKAGREWYARLVETLRNVVTFHVKQHDASGAAPVTYESLMQGLPTDFTRSDPVFQGRPVPGKP